MRIGSFLLALSFLFPGCATQMDIEELYKREASLDAKIEKISQDIDAMKKEAEEREKRLSQVEKNLAHDYSELQERLEELAKKENAFVSPSEGSSDDFYAIADSHYLNGKYEEAILAYQRFIATHPDDARVPISYLRQGLSLISLGKSDQAKFFFETLISKFPKSKEARTAREKLREIKENRS